MTSEPVAPPRPVGRVAVVSVSVVVIAMALVWCFVSMRTVMDVGGACADGGPYVGAQPCPDGTWLIAIAVPLMLIAAFAGTAAALSLGAPDLLLPMWFLLFSSLGVNFLDYGFFSEPTQWSWIVCGVVFELMALPALYVLLPFPGSFTWPEPEKRKQGKNRPPPLASTRVWWTAYAGLGLVGVLLGWLVWDALR